MVVAKANRFLKNRRQAAHDAAVSESRVKYAAVVLDHAPDLADPVLSRHMPKGQKAIDVAFQYPDGEKTGRGSRSASRITAESAIPGKRVSEARAVLRHSRELAMSVLKGDTTHAGVAPAARRPPQEA
jgi:hypothetical protein